MIDKIRKLGQEFFVGAAFLLFGLVNLFVVIPNTIRVHYNPLMATVAVVQNGRVMPSVYTVIIIVSAAVILVQQLLRIGKEEATPLEPFMWDRFKTNELISLAYVCVAILFTLIMSYIGFVPAVIVCFVALCLLYGYNNYKVMVAVTILLPAALYYILTKLLYVSL